MKKISSSATLGGMPIYKSDLRTVFNDEIWSVLQGLFEAFNDDTEGVIISGCGLSGGGPYSISAGIVYLDGEFRRLSAASGLTLPKYIVSSAYSNDTRTFADGTSNVSFVTKGAELVNSAPVSGQYIAITSFGDPDDRRMQDNFFVNRYNTIALYNSLSVYEGIRTASSGPFLKTKVIEIGDWDMDANSLVTVSHGITDGHLKIRSISVMIRNDTNTGIYPFPYPGEEGIDYAPQLRIPGIGDTSLTITRKLSGFFDDALFDSTGYNRGWITIQYEA